MEAWFIMFGSVKNEGAHHINEWLCDCKVYVISKLKWWVCCVNNLVIFSLKKISGSVVG
jgi:hypothetical protein